MNRWTERFNSDGEKAIAIHDGSDFLDTCFEGEREYDVMNALAEYEDLEEQGLLVRLPCKVGTEVYYILGIPNKMPCAIDKCVFRLSDVHKIGESLFLTREEAEKKLEEMKNAKNA